MNNYFHERECQNSDEREQSLIARLASFISYAKQECEYYQQSLKHIDADKITSRELLAQIPITRKSDLIPLQNTNFPLGGLNAAKANIHRIFQSPWANIRP